MKKNNEYPRYIPDIPMGEDWFEGKSHERLSKVIAQHIKDNDSAKESALPRLIGIEGAWGSGKSNVVELIKNSLNDSKYHFFEYDAWGNQEDLQRRSFLEQLTKNLIEKGVLSGKVKTKMIDGKDENLTWEEKYRYLVMHKRETVYESVPELNGGPFLVFLASLFTVAFSNIAEIITGQHLVWLKVIISLTPIVLSFFYWLYKAFTKPAKYRTWRYFTAILTNKIRSEHSYETIYEEEPSVIQFKKWMSDVSVELGNKGKKLVIVFDNMDRLPAEKVKQLWSSINTFFAGHGFCNIWVVVPFDREHLSRVFPDSGSNGEENTGSSLAQHFIDKTFTITFDVPKPVISDYKG